MSGSTPLTVEQAREQAMNIMRRMDCADLFDDAVYALQVFEQTLVAAERERAVAAVEGLAGVECWPEDGFSGRLVHRAAVLAAIAELRKAIEGG